MLIGVLVFLGGAWILVKGINSMTEYSYGVLGQREPVHLGLEIFYLLAILVGSLICLYSIHYTKKHRI